MKLFPAGLEKDYSDKKKRKLISSLLLGNRFRSDQTLYEYLIEFLLVFSSAKDSDLETGKNEFHSGVIEGELNYWVEPRMALRRFVFYDKSRKNGTIKADEYAYKDMMNILMNRMENIGKESKEEYLEGIQDLFHGYAVVIKNRFWGAQALLPICPEFMFCGCDPNEKNRRDKVKYEDGDKIKVDTEFNFTKRNFLSRGGEVYYLHLLQGLEGIPEKKKKLEDLLRDMVIVQCKKISKMARFIQESWEEDMEFDKHKLYQKLSVSFIPENAYVGCEKNSIDELINYLSCKIHQINRVDIHAKGVMFQILRMMSYAVANELGEKPKKWIVDMRGKTSTDTVKKLSAESFRSVEDDFMTVLNSIAVKLGLSGDESMDAVRKAKKDSLDIFRSKGKELQCIIPANGPFERFSLSEDVIRFLVLALIEPQEKMTLDMFLEKLYENYNIVIGPVEYKKMQGEENELKENELKENELKENLTNSFNENVIAFSSFLKATGFLRELSDATSIVVNPYTRVSVEDEL